MRPALLAAALVCAALPGPAAVACTAFCVYGNGRALVGNNEDFWNPNTRVWFEPAAEGRYGRVYFGFADLHPQGGMNDQGLFFDGFATATNRVTGSRDKPRFPGNLADEAMATCATVDEVIALFRRYNLDFLDSAMLMFADRHGGSVIVEGDVFVKKTGKFQVTTNFYQSMTPAASVSCDRYRIATAMLGEAPEVSVDLCRRILAATHNEADAPTQYSNVYDLERGIVHLYHFHNYAEEVVIDLKEELRKGKHTLDLPSLFPRSFAFESFQRKREKQVREAREARRAREVDRSRWGDYEGEYGTGEAARDRRITIVRDGEKLLGTTADGRRIELIPEAEDRFFQIDDYGTMRFTFARDAQGVVTRLTILREELGREITVTRVAPESR